MKILYIILIAFEICLLIAQIITLISLIKRNKYQGRRFKEKPNKIIIHNLSGHYQIEREDK